jgi:hypothetical protein
MKKLKLELEELVAESFEPVREVEEEEGTVHGYATKIHQYTCDPAVGTCFGYTCIHACF